jgi:hypothetical protein
MKITLLATLRQKQEDSVIYFLFLGTILIQLGVSAVTGYFFI